MPPTTTLSSDGKAVAEVAFENCIGQRAVGQGLVCFTLAVKMEPRAEDRSFRTDYLGGSVCDERGLLIGDFGPVTLDLKSPEPQERVRPTNVVLSVPIRFDQVRSLDEQRDHKGGLILGLNLYVQVSMVRMLERASSPPQLIGHSFRLKADGTLLIPLNASSWKERLDEMGWEDRATFEVPVKGGVLDTPAFQKAAASLQKALRAQADLEWDVVVARCRDVMGELEKAVPKQPPQRKDWSEKDAADPKARRLACWNWDQDQRLTFLRQAVHHVTDAAHHLNQLPRSFTPEEARLVLAATGLFLKHHSKI